VNIFAIKRSDETLIELGDDGVCGPVALVLNGLDLLDAHVQIAGILEDAAEKLRSLSQVTGELVEELEKLCFVWN